MEGKVRFPFIKSAKNSSQESKDGETGRLLLKW